MALFHITHLHFACNTDLQGTSRRDFDTYITLISSVHPSNFDATAHEVATKEDEGCHIVCYHKISFVPSDVARSFLEIRHPHRRGRVQYVRTTYALGFLHAGLLEQLDADQLHCPGVGGLFVGDHPDPAQEPLAGPHAGDLPGLHHCCGPPARLPRTLSFRSRIASCHCGRGIFPDLEVDPKRPNAIPHPPSRRHGRLRLWI